MTIARVDFYVLKTENPHLLKMTACRLIEKIYKQGMTIFVCVENEEEATVLDSLLWTFRQGSFVPHERYGAHGPMTPVLIGCVDAVPEGGRDVLLNLARKLPVGIEAFRRVADLVDQTPDVRQAGRLRYRAYQAFKIEILTHTI